MATALTLRAQQSLQKIKKEPSLVVEFDGIAKRFGSAVILKIVKIGDPDLTIGGGWKIGGFIRIQNQIDALSFSTDFGATSTKIDYKLNPDRGLGSSVASLELALVDTPEHEILDLVSSSEFLGRKCRIYISPDASDTSFPDDYITIFRGIVDNVSAGPGVLVFNISHPDQKKRQSLFERATTELSAGINSSVTTIPVLDTTDFLIPVNGPSGSNDSTLKFYFRIDDEIIRYTGKTATSFTGCTRGQLGTSSASHNSGTGVDSFYRLTGPSAILALKIMLSGVNGNYETGVVVSSFVRHDAITTVANSIFFLGVDISERYGLTIGDYITTAGATNGANNVSLKTIESIVRVPLGSYIVVNSVSLVEEFTTAATISFRSKYDTLGRGLAMSPELVDVAEHERLNSLFLSGFEYDVYLKDSIVDGKDFIERELYSPISCYSIPRRARSSLGYHIGPLPTETVPILNEENVLNPGSIAKKRSLGRNFYNTIVYKFDEDELTDKARKGFLRTNATSKTQIPVGNKSLIIDAPGLRDVTTAELTSARRLNRYAFAAEYFTNVKVTFEAGFNIDVGDIVALDGTRLLIPDIVSGENITDTKLYEVVSKTINIQNGAVSIELVDTSFSLETRYALISPASRVKNGISQSEFVIESSFASVFGANEYRKWERFTDLTVTVHNSSHSITGTAKVQSFSGNTVTLASSLGFVPAAGYIMEMATYNNTTETIRAIYGFMSESDGDNFDDGKASYLMI